MEFFYCISGRFTNSDFNSLRMSCLGSSHLSMKIESLLCFSHPEPNEERLYFIWLA
jgi:hypothetical protein